MSWIIALAFFGFCWWHARRARERVAELVPTGMLRSLLYWVSNATDSACAVYRPHSASIAGSGFPLDNRLGNRRGFAFPAARSQMAISRLELTFRHKF
jgi:hypothetical protein